MNSKIFTSQNGWFRLTLSPNWDEYELEDEEGTYGFFNSHADRWMGNLRVTPLKLSGIMDNNNGKIENHIDDQVAEHKDAIRMRMADFDCAFYKEDRESQNDRFLIYYWIMGREDFLFVCSFTINKEEELTKENELELQTVHEIIKSIQII